MNYILLSVFTVIVVDFCLRVLMYSKTKDSKYKHDLNVWFRKGAWEQLLKTGTKRKPRSKQLRKKTDATGKRNPAVKAAPVIVPSVSRAGEAGYGIRTAG